jgi:SH3-like domain-containing protein
MYLCLNYIKIISISFCFLFIITFVSAKEQDLYLSLKNLEVNVRQGPSFDYPIKFIYKKKFLPIKIIDSSNNFKKIVDINKNSGWIHRSQLSKKK